jgi:hypothetical protein
VSYPSEQILAQLETAADRCWAEATAEYRSLSDEDRDRLMNALETTKLTAVMLLPGHLLHVLCGFALAAMVETRLRVERRNLEGNDDDDFYNDFEPD